MGRKKKDSVDVRARMERGKFERLRSLAIALGYSYSRDELIQPAWTEFMEAIADGDLVLYKKVEEGVDKPR